MKKNLFFLVIIVVLQSCHVPVKRDYQGLSGSLVLNQDKKWLINNLYSDLNSDQREELNKKISEKFQSLTHGNAVTIEQANAKNLLPAKISFTPDLDQLECLQTNSNFDYLVNIRTKKISDQISALELSQPFEYSKNEAFAVLEVYDLKTLKKIYSQKASSEVAMEGKKIYPEISGEQLYTENAQGQNSKGPYFTYSADALSVKNLKKILKDIDKKAIK